MNIYQSIDEFSDRPKEEKPQPRHHRAVQDVLKFFTWQELPDDLKAVSKAYCDVAIAQSVWAPNSSQTVVALQLLLQARDAAIRAVLDERLMRDRR